MAGIQGLPGLVLHLLETVSVHAASSQYHCQEPFADDMRKLKRAIQKSLGIRHKPKFPHSQRSYSQEGEDLVLMRLIDDARKRQGFYVDVGAHHPSRFSNTCLFYELGWRGINIDPRPGFAAEFISERPDDIAVETAIGSQPGNLKYYMFDEPALNGFDHDLSTDRDSNSNYNIICTHDVAVQTLATVLGNTVPPGQSIDFMSIDVEGLDLSVIQSNDWQRFRPTYVLVEIFGETLQQILDSESALFLQDCGYQACSRTRHTVFFVDSAAGAKKRAA